MKKGDYNFCTKLDYKMLFAFKKDNTVAIRLHVPSTTSDAKPVNIAFLLDISQSMEGPRLDAVKKTLHAAGSLFRDEDRVTVITFSSAATILFDHHRMADKERFYAAIDAIRVDSCTDLSCGFESLLNTTVDYDAVILLTDGIVNRGLTSMAGLQTIALATRAATHCIGYGADHNRMLLRNLALKSKGSYSYISSDELLPIAIGDIISGLRSEILQNATLTLPDGWICDELDSASNSFVLGNITADRDYWAVFHSTEGAAPFAVKFTATDAPGITLSEINEGDPALMQDQIFRCRTVSLMSRVSSALEGGRYDAALTAEVKALHDEIDPSSPLLARLKAQLSELLITYIGPPPPSMLARLTSQTAYFSTQRGVDPGDPTAAIFSSPSQRANSCSVQSQYVDGV